MLDVVTFREFVEAAKACLAEKRFDEARLLRTGVGDF
jgi:hypothetical protein